MTPLSGIVIAQTDRDKGSHGINAFIIEKGMPGFEIGPKENKLGIDEHGEYPAGSWLRSPHMSKHFPRVEEETLILVKVGHLQCFT